jgi:hypothetical protein
VYLAGYIFISISTLFFFKYFNKTLLPAINHWSSQDFAFQLVPPIGISFFLFQSISYVFDINRHKVRPTNSFKQYFLYISFFPQIVAGPIVKARDFLYQIPRQRSLNWKAFQTGGTDWRNPFNMAYTMNPRPQVIFFMTDGATKNPEETVEKVKKNRTIQVNSIAFGIGSPQAEAPMKEMAKVTRGTFKAYTKPEIAKMAAKL